MTSARKHMERSHRNRRRNYKYNDATFFKFGLKGEQRKAIKAQQTLTDKIMDFFKGLGTHMVNHNKKG